MKYEINTPAKSFQVDLLLENDRLMIRTESEEMTLAAIQIHRGVYSVLFNKRSFVVGVCSGNDQKINVNGTPVFVELLDAVHLHLRELGWELMQELKAGLVSTQIPGLITRIFHQVGDEVIEGEPLFLIEAMKMENEIKAPLAGIIKKISVQQGQTVDKGTNIIEIG